MIDYSIIDKFNLPRPETLSDEEVEALHDAFLHALNYRKTLKCEREKQEIVDQMNALLRKFSRVRTYEISLKNNYNISYGSAAYIQGCNDSGEYTLIGDYGSPVFGFAIDTEGDLMAVLDSNHPVSDWGN